MKIYLVISLVLMSACNSILPNSHLSTQKTKEEIAFQLKRQTHKEGISANPIIATEKTAVKVAEAILFNVYGEEKIKEEKPYTIGFADGYWLIYGYLPQDSKGGVFEIIINSNNGEVVHLSHGK